MTRKEATAALTLLKYMAAFGSKEGDTINFNSPSFDKLSEEFNKLSKGKYDYDEMLQESKKITLEQAYEIIKDSPGETKSNIYYGMLRLIYADDEAKYAEYAFLDKVAGSMRLSNNVREI